MTATTTQRQLSLFKVVPTRAKQHRPARPTKKKPATFRIDALIARYASTLTADEQKHAALFIAQHLEITDTHLRRLRASEKQLDRDQADLWATKLGWHPSEIWSNWGQQ